VPDVLGGRHVTQLGVRPEVRRDEAGDPMRSPGCLVACIGHRRRVLFSHPLEGARRQWGVGVNAPPSWLMGVSLRLG
jgi:hypothetical protein